MRRTDAALKAAAAAASAIRDYGVSALPVDPIALAEQAGIKVVAMPADTQGVSGMLIRRGNSFAIGYATHVQSKGFQNFSIAHELGHYFMEGHADAVFDASGVHQSNAGFSSDDRYEIEADHFASALLMPEALFRTAADRSGTGLAAIESLATLCVTSLTATAIRYTQCTDEAAAIVMSSRGRVHYCFMSKTFEELAGTNRIQKGEQVPPGTPTAELNKAPERIENAERLDGVTELQDWLGGRHQVELLEEVVGLGGYGRALTVLTTREAVDIEELEEDEEMLESWTPRFRR